MTEPPIRVLFVCTGNAARSQLAEALLRAMGGAAFHVASAGTAPAGVHPRTLRELGLRGIDASGATSKRVADAGPGPWDHVITVCDRARDTCPVIPGAHTAHHWGLDDPAAAEGDDAAQQAAFARTADALVALLAPFLAEARAARAAG